MLRVLRVVLLSYLACALAAKPAQDAQGQSDELAAINTKKANAIVALNKAGTPSPCLPGQKDACGLAGSTDHPRYLPTTGPVTMPVKVAHTGKLFTVHRVNNTKPHYPVVVEKLPSAGGARGENTEYKER